MEIKPIRTEEEYEAALEEKHFPIPEPDDPVEMLLYYLESRGLIRSDLIPYLLKRSLSK